MNCLSFHSHLPYTLPGISTCILWWCYRHNAIKFIKLYKILAFHLWLFTENYGWLLSRYLQCFLKKSVWLFWRERRFWYFANDAASTDLIELHTFYSGTTFRPSNQKCISFPSIYTISSSIYRSLTRASTILCSVLYHLQPVWMFQKTWYVARSSTTPVLPQFLPSCASELLLTKIRT